MSLTTPERKHVKRSGLVFQLLPPDPALHSSQQILRSVFSLYKLYVSFSCAPCRAEGYKIILINSNPVSRQEHMYAYTYHNRSCCTVFAWCTAVLAPLGTNASFRRLQATIMTDPETADRTYIGPMTLEAVEEIIAKVSRSSCLELVIAFTLCSDRPGFSTDTLDSIYSNASEGKNYLYVVRVLRM